MTEKPKDVRGYLEELERNREGKPDQVKDGIDTYIELWNRAIGKGVVSHSDRIDEALAKLEAAGGLYKAAED